MVLPEQEVRSLRGVIFILTVVISGLPISWDEDELGFEPRFLGAFKITGDIGSPVSRIRGV
jgi:hypothetical protein